MNKFRCIYFKVYLTDFWHYLLLIACQVAQSKAVHLVVVRTCH